MSQPGRANIDGLELCARVRLGMRIISPLIGARFGREWCDFGVFSRDFLKASALVLDHAGAVTEALQQKTAASARTQPSDLNARRGAYLPTSPLTVVAA